MRWLSITAALLLSSSVAHANGQFPGAGQLVIDRNDPQHLVLRTTFGMVVSRDGGATWGWVCETGVGYMNEEPATAIAGDGSILAAWSAGMSRSSSDACDWMLAAGLEPAAVDVSVQKNDPSVAVAVTIDPTTRAAYVWESLDQGQSWQQLATPLPAGFEPTTLDPAPSDPMRIYVAGSNTAGEPAFAVTGDRGQQWTVGSFPGGGAPDEVPYVAAVDPLDADVVYVRMLADPGRLLASQDGGQSWIHAFGGIGPLRGFSLSPDGQSIMVSDVVSAWRGSSSSLEFEKRSDTILHCLTWTERGLYACSNQYVEGFFVGLSHDEGATFEPILNMNCIVPLECAAETSAGSVCDAEWPAVSAQLSIHLCDEGGGGAGGAGGAGAAPASGPGVGGAGTGAAGDVPSDSPSDCHCALAGGSRSQNWLYLMLLVAHVAHVARRRRQGAMTSRQAARAAARRSGRP